jgi:hypothetical protein
MNRDDHLIFEVYNDSDPFYQSNPKRKITKSKFDVGDIVANKEDEFITQADGSIITFLKGSIFKIIKKKACGPDNRWLYSVDDERMGNKYGNMFYLVTKFKPEDYQTASDLLDI